MAGSYTRYPNASISSNPAVGTNGTTAPTSSTEVAGVNGAGNLTPISVDNSGNQNVNVVSTIDQLDSVTSGTITANNQAIVLTQKPGSSSWSIQLTGTFSAGSTVAWQVSDDGTTWIGVNGRQTGTGNSAAILVTSVSGPGPYTFRGNLAGTTYFRVITTAYQTGDAIAVVIHASEGVGAVFLNSAIPGGVNIIGKFGIDQTTPGTTNAVSVTNFPSGGSTAALQSSTQGPVTPGTVATNSTLIGGQYNSPLPTLTSGQQAAAQLDSSGRMIIRPLTSADVVSAAQSGTWNITNISGTVTLPTLAATSTLQTSGNASLTTIATNSGTQATAANQTSGNASLTSIATNTNRLGTLTDGSGSTSATVSTSTQIFAANAARKYLLVQNLSITAAIYLNFTSAATASTGSYYIAPQGSFVMESGYVSTEALNVLSATASVPYSAKQG